MRKKSNAKEPAVKSNIRSVSGKPLLHMETLLNVSRRLASYETLDEMLKALVEMVSVETNAERASLFMRDDRTNELYTKVAQGELQREIRILDSIGIAGYVYTTGENLIVHNPYSDNRFDRSSDEFSGFVTKNILCVPIKTVKGKIIGVVEALNKRKGRFTKSDLKLLEAMSTQAAIFLQATQYVENINKSREQEMEFLDVVSEVTSEINLKRLIQKVMSEAARMLLADRTTLFLNDEKTGQLWSELGGGLESSEIRFANHLGIAGAVFQSGNAVNIPYAYADLRFNPVFDKEINYFTRSILCVPVVNKNGKIIGVTQALNKRGGPFTNEDESRLRAFTAQVSIALENATLFNDIQNMKNYNDSILESMSNGVITMNEDGKIVTCNSAGLRVLGIDADDIINYRAEDFFVNENRWVYEKLMRVVETQKQEILVDAELKIGNGTLSVNLTALPLLSGENRKLGSMLMIEDITNEKRMKSTMSRYMDPVIADRLLERSEDLLGGKNVTATVLFSDIRGFTTLSEELGPQSTVRLLNEYFTIMVEAIQGEGGMLDKFIGDAIMAVFGIPSPREDDEDRGLRAAISMINRLAEWNRQRNNEGKKSVDMGIGLNTGAMVSGNIGSPKRMDFTIIGDGVNLAARLESACKQYAARILLSENSYKKLKGSYRIREIDLVVVKGKTEPVAVYEALDYHDEKSFPNIMEVLSFFKDAVRYYREQRWDKSIGLLKKALHLNPEDRLSQMYIDRCGFMKDNPPEADWDGVWVMKAK